jgi:hypothetical protein
MLFYSQRQQQQQQQQKRGKKEKNPALNIITTHFIPTKMN